MTTVAPPLGTTRPPIRRRPGNPVNLFAPLIRRPIGTSLLAIGLTLSGICAYLLLGVAALPTLDFPAVFVAAQQPGYALVNLRLTYRNDNLGMSIAGAVTNVFNQYYYTTITDQLESFGFLSASVGRPREWSITLRKKF